MKKVSAIALALAVSTGMASLAAAPAFAAKKEKAPAAKSWNLSKEFRAALAPVQAAIKAGDTAGAASGLATVEGLSVSPDEKFVAAATRLDLANAIKDPAMQYKALNGMIDSGSAPAADLPKFNFFAGSMAYNAKDYQTAVARLTESVRLGHPGPDKFLLLAESYFKMDRAAEGLSYVEKAVADATQAGQKAPDTWYKRAVAMAYKVKSGPETAKWSRALVKAYPNPENWRDALIIYRDANKVEGQQLLDVYRLMRAAKALAGERDFFEYAQLATERALPGEAKATIEEGFASGAVNKSSRAVSEMLTLATQKIPGDKASLAASEKQANASPNGKAAAGTADAFLGYAEYARAIPLYRMALQKGGIDVDQVNTRLGIALAMSGQAAEARQVFAAVKGPRADVAGFWTLWLDSKGAPAS